jgi:hypothetical protein
MNKELTFSLLEQSTIHIPNYIKLAISCYFCEHWKTQNMPVLKYLLVILFISIHLPFSAQQRKTNHFQNNKTTFYLKSLGLLNVTDMDKTLLVDWCMPIQQFHRQNLLR